MQRLQRFLTAYDMVVFMLIYSCRYSELECMASWFNPTLMSRQYCFIGVSGADVQECLALCTRLLDN